MNAKRLLFPLLVVATAAGLFVRMFSKLFATTSSPRSESIDDAYDAIDAYVQKELHRLNIPGASLAIVQGDKIVHTRGFGRARPGGKVPAPQTPFLIGSLTKSFTALAVMQLAEAGKIDLDCPVQHYLPWFRVADPRASAQITIRHPLNQTSGLPNWPGSAALADFDNRPGAAERQLRTLSTLKLDRAVGSKFEYCNSNYDLLGLVVEAGSGETYSDYVHKHIFAPLDMDHSYTALDEAKKDGLAVGHLLPFFFPVAVSNLPIPLGSQAGGELISCAEDMARYLVAQLNGGRYRDVQVLSHAGIDEMHRGAVDWNEMGASIGKYAMGWADSDTGGTRTVWHSGNCPDFTAYMAILPDQKRGAVLLMNAGHNWMVPIGGELGSGLAALLAGDKPRPSPFGFSFSRWAPLAMRALLLVPALQIAGVLATLARWRDWRRHPEHRPSPQRAWGIHILLPLVPNLSLAAVPILLHKKGWLPFMKLFFPDAAWLSIVCGSFAGMWSVLRTWLVLRASRDTRTKAA